MDLVKWYVDAVHLILFEILWSATFGFCLFTLAFVLETRKAVFEIRKKLLEEKESAPSPSSPTSLADSAPE